jgi:hypothetical protein
MYQFRTVIFDYDPTGHGHRDNNYRDICCNYDPATGYNRTG